MLYRAENSWISSVSAEQIQDILIRLTITPKLKLNEDARKTLLSCILKFFLLGINRTNTSMHIMLAPATQANGGVS